MNKKGFTLVELIVVIAIIAVLSITGFISYQGYIAKARDSKRMEELSSLQTTITAFNANKAFLPRCAGSSTVCKVRSCTTGITTDCIQAADWTGLNIQSQPIDPKKTAAGADLYYVYGQNGTDFQLAATLENYDGGKLLKAYVVGTKNADSSTNAIINTGFSGDTATTCAAVYNTGASNPTTTTADCVPYNFR